LQKDRKTKRGVGDNGNEKLLIGGGGKERSKSEWKKLAIRKLNSATVCTLTVPVPSLGKGGGRH